MQQSTCSLANKLYIILCGLALAFAAPALAQQGNARGPIGDSPYEIISGWHTPFQEPGFAFGGNSGVWAESPDRIIIAQRGETILPYPVPENFPGYAGALGINVLREVNRRHWQNCLYILNGDGEVVEIWDHLDYISAKARKAPAHIASASAPTTPRTASGWLMRPSTRFT